MERDVERRSTRAPGVVASHSDSNAGPIVTIQRRWRSAMKSEYSVSFIPATRSLAETRHNEEEELPIKPVTTRFA